MAASLLLKDDDEEVAQRLESQVVPWESYLAARLLSDQDLQAIKRWDCKRNTKDVRAKLLAEVRARRAAAHAWRVPPARREWRGPPRTHPRARWLGTRATAWLHACAWPTCWPAWPPPGAPAWPPPQAGPMYVGALMGVLKAVSKEDTVQYVLALLLQMLQGACGRVARTPPPAPFGLACAPSG